MTVPKIPKLSWARSGLKVPKSERQAMLKALRQAKKAGRLRELDKDQERPD